MARTRNGITGWGLKLAGPVAMVVVLFADHWLPVHESSTADLTMVLLGLVALSAGMGGLLSAVVSGGILLSADWYAIHLGRDAIAASNWTPLLSLLLAVILIVISVGFRPPARPAAGETVAPPGDKASSAHLRRVDVVTGLLTRHFVMGMAQIEWDRWRRYATPFSLLLVDVDGLDALRRSDPAKADSLLRVLANRLTSSLRAMDVASRIDDGRFLILLPQTNEAGAVVAGKKLLKAVQVSRVDGSDGNTIADLRIAAASALRHDDRLQNVLQGAEAAMEIARQPGFEGVATRTMDASRKAVANG